MKSLIAMVQITKEVNAEFDYTGGCQVKYLGYILTFGDGEYVESYSLAGKEVTSTYEKEDAKVFASRVEADYIAEKIGCEVESI